MRTLICQHCGRQVLKNRKLKHLEQRYCGNKACQAARKQSFGREKYRANSSFRSEKLQRSRDRLKTKEGRVVRASYQHEYRSSHPDYVLANRQKQRVRNARRTANPRDKTKIVNPDALMLQHADNDAVYAMIPVNYEKIVNPDTLMPYLSVIEEHTRQKPLFVRLL